MSWPVEPLVQRMGGGERLQFGDEPVVMAQVQLGVDAHLGRAQPPAFEPGHFPVGQQM
jgi:hypothetical protein